ncbi:MAG TPA: MFS transporter [Kiritimatiellia bacterium]|nr:MFS transporter [Kiritimatiellia bacterium]
MSSGSMHHQTEARDRIPVGQKLAFGLGMATPIAFVNSVAQLTNLIFNIGMGVSPILLGAAQMIPRLWDAISDPLAGYFSDNTRSRWGRRRPYILAGGITTGIFYAGIWFISPSMSEYMILAYYLAATLLFFTAVTLYSVPLVALGYEMTGDYHERTRLFAYGSFIGNVCAILTPWMYRAANLEIFDNEVEGMKYVGLFVAGIIIVTAIVCASLCREKHYRDVSSQPRIHFWSSLRAVMKNRTYVRLIASIFLITAGFNFVNGFSNYIMIYYVFDGAKAAASTVMGINGTAWAIAALIAVFPMTWSSRRFGKARTIQVAILFMVAGNLLKVVCYNREYPLLTLIPTVLISIGMLVLYTMAGSMIADICDEDELDYGVRREGSFSSLYSWWLKMAVSSAYLVAGVMLASTRFDHTLIQQSEYTLFWLRFWEISLPSLLCLAGVALLIGYPLTEERAYRNKALLEERRRLAGREVAS